MQYDDITLAEVCPDDEDEMYAMARLADEEGIKHGVWVARAWRVSDENLNQLQDGVNPENGESFSEEDRIQRIIKTINRLYDVHYERGQIKTYKIFKDDDLAGFMLYMDCFGGPYLHFLTTDDYSDAEDKADLIASCIPAAIPLLDFFFAKSTNHISMQLYVFLEDVDDMEFSLGQIGFEQLEDMDYYDYERLACFALSREAFLAFKDSLE